MSHATPTVAALGFRRRRDDDKSTKSKKNFHVVPLLHIISQRGRQRSLNQAFPVQPQVTPHGRVLSEPWTIPAFGSTITPLESANAEPGPPQGAPKAPPHGLPAADVPPTAQIKCDGHRAQEQAVTSPHAQSPRVTQVPC